MQRPGRAVEHCPCSGRLRFGFWRTGLPSFHCQDRSLLCAISNGDLPGSGPLVLRRGEDLLVPFCGRQPGRSIASRSVRIAKSFANGSPHRLAIDEEQSSSRCRSARCPADRSIGSEAAHRMFCSAMSCEGREWRVVRREVRWRRVTHARRGSAFPIHLDGDCRPVRMLFPSFVVEKPPSSTAGSRTFASPMPANTSIHLRQSAPRQCSSGPGSCPSVPPRA